VPGLDLVQSGGRGGLVQAYLRGAKSDQVLVFVDGVEVNDPSSAAREADLSQIPLADVLRIEVLRGPQSTLYGSDAMGGVINIITRRGEGPAHVALSAEGGSFSTFNETAGARGGTTNVNYAVAASRQDSEGFFQRQRAQRQHRARRLRQDGAVGPHRLDAGGRLHPRRAGALEQGPLRLRRFPERGAVDADNEGEAEHVLLRTEGDLTLFDGCGSKSSAWAWRTTTARIARRRPTPRSTAGSPRATGSTTVSRRGRRLTAGLEHEQESAERFTRPAPRWTASAGRRPATRRVPSGLCPAGNASATPACASITTANSGARPRGAWPPCTDTRHGHADQGDVRHRIQAPSLFQLYSSTAARRCSRKPARVGRGVRTGPAGQPGDGRAICSTTA